jgi:hypothetical protein
MCAISCAALPLRDVNFGLGQAVARKVEEE